MNILYCLLLLCILPFQAICIENWTNCIGNQSCQPSLYYEPTTLEELRHQIKDCASKGYKIRAIGNGYSISNIGCTTGCLLNLKHLNHILSIDKEKKLVRVEAGIALKEFNEQIAKHHLALSNQAAISEITLGGALNTGVHGTGRTGTLSSFVKEIELITADGTLRRLSRASDPDAFSAASVGLGSLGVIYAVTMQCESLFYLELNTETLSIENVIENYKALHQSNDFFQFLWNIDSGQVVVSRWNRCKPNNQHNHSTMKCQPSYQALTWYVIDPSDKDLFSEIAVPIDALPNALMKIKQIAEKHKKFGAVMTDVNIRFVESDEYSYLSPAAGRSVAYIALCILEEDKYLAFFKEFEDALIMYQGRPHWGKINFLNHEKAIKLYGTNLQKFISIKKRLDPDNRFSNDFTNRIFGYEN